MVDVILGLGSNLGDRALNMRKIEQEIGLLLNPPITRSCLMETEPIGTGPGQAWFYNRIVRGGYAGTPRELLDRCLSIENKLGRQRQSSERYAARTADIDILLFGDAAINGPDLVVPHPGILKRKFCIMGLKEIAGEREFPGRAGRIKELAVEWERDVMEQKIRIVREGGLQG